LKEYNKIKR